jgi:uncharacterized protein YeaO (DUF488 family)
VIATKRVYLPAAPTDGVRVLVDRLWPRGLTKESARVDRWWRDLAPSDALRKEFAHVPERYPSFRAKYRRELAARPEEVERLAAMAREGTVTLLYGARDGRCSNARVLEELVVEHLTEGTRRTPARRGAGRRR